MNPARAIAVAEEPQRAGTNTIEPSQLLETATDVVLQGLRLLFQLDDRAYSKVAPAPYHASIGSHFSRALSDCAASSTASAPERSTTTDRNETRASNNR